MTTENSTVYRLAPAVAARLLGVVLVAIAVLILVGTLAIAVVDLPTVVLLVPVARTTTIPVEMLAVDREAFVRDVQAHLQQGHGLRTW